MQDSELRFRQIHLDFHTSEAIDGIASDFDADAFADTLVKARVNSINLFARCHHGWVYYDSKQFPERIHPHLTNRNLLKQQIEACHRRGIKAPIYLPIQWDQYTAERHPEWLTMTPDGRQEGTPPYEAGFYRSLCVNTPYVEFIRKHMAELFDLFEVDGFWIDIVQPKDCSCYTCRQGMIQAGLDPSITAVRKAYGLDVLTKFKKDLTAFIRARSKDCTIFYNAGHVGTRERRAVDTFSHFELESIAGGCWGYMHFPVAVRYARTLGLDCLGMTGKFHTAWGDFHSYKNPAAMDYECFRMLAFNSKCCVGDQLHPRGKMCKATYDLIGQTYAQIEKKEPWCVGAKAVVDIGVLNPEEWDIREPVEGLHPSILGASRMLQEGGHQFDIIDSQAVFSDYKLLVLPDNIPVCKKLAAKLEQYLKAGGAVIASFESGLDESQKQFASPVFGVSLTDGGPIDNKGRASRGRWYYGGDYVDYLKPGKMLAGGLPASEYVMYLRGTSIKAAGGTETLADAVSSYFDRTYEHFCSHLQTPSSGKVYQPAVVKNGKLIYFCHPIFTTYDVNAPLWCKRLFLNAVDMLLPSPAVRHNGPSFILATLNRQDGQKRCVLHLLNYIPEQRSQKIAVVEDVFPTNDVAVSVRADKSPTAVAAVPDGTALPFTFKDGRVEFIVPKIAGHQMVSIQFS